MAFLMTDAAAGSNAAMTMMQNMGAAPLAADVGKAQAEQVIANTERTKLANLISESGFKASEDSKAKLKTIAQTPEFKAADDVKKLTMLAAGQMESGQVEDGAKNLQAAELLEAKQLANQEKLLSNQAREITKAAAVINAVPENKIQETFDRLPEANRKVVLEQVGGQEQWGKFSNAEKKAALNNLMMNGDRKIAAQAAALEEMRQTKLGESRERVATINANWHMANKATGGSKEELSTFRAYTNKVASEDKRFTGIESRLTKAISDAKVIYEASLLQNKPDQAALSEMKSRQADLDDIRRRQVQAHISAATMLPAGAQRDSIMAELTKQAEIIGIKTDSKKTDKPKEVPSNKQQEEVTAKAKKDPAMKGNTFGKYVEDKGVEVFDSKGKLIGHYK